MAENGAGPAARVFAAPGRYIQGSNAAGSGGPFSKERRACPLWRIDIRKNTAESDMRRWTGTFVAAKLGDRAAALAFVWVVVGVCRHLVGDHLFLRGDELLDSTSELRVADLVRAIR